MYTAADMADAELQIFPRVGGHVHDWRWLFDRYDTLDSARTIATTVHLGATMLALLAVWLVWHEIESRSAVRPARTAA